MRPLNARLALAGALLAVCLPGSAKAAPVITISAQGLANAALAETTFLGGLGVSVTESFEGFSAVYKSTTVVTSVGSFKQLEKGNEIKDCTSAPIGGCTGLVVLKASESPFDGRFAAGAAHWLDSNDSKKMSFEAVAPWNSIGFYITDPSDVGAKLKLKGYNGAGVEVFSKTLFDPDLASGRVYYVSIYDALGIKSLTFYSDAGSDNDGFGLDKFTVGNSGAVPEPGSLFLLGAGLVGFAALRRRHL